ncbi:MAG: DUF4190 domain-containing protein [Friedmanniella sp.]
MTDQGPGSGSEQPDGDDRRAERREPPAEDADAPNPFSREGTAAGAASADPPDAGRTAGQQVGPASPADPYSYPPDPGPAPATPGPGYPAYGPTGSGGPDGDGDPYQAYGYNHYPSAQPQPDPYQPYGQPSPDPYQPPGAQQHSQQPPAPGPQPPPGYGGYGAPEYGNPDPAGYGVAPYPGGYGGQYPDYGTGAVQHPQSTAALVTGIVAAVLGLACAVGGFVGIVAIVLGLKVRRDIDSDPARYTGRSRGTAGLVLGIVSVVALIGWVLLVLAISASTSS